VTKADTHQAEENEKEHPIFYIFKYFREIVNDLSLKIRKKRCRNPEIKLLKTYAGF
jgi:hypothetical protein